jgi:hypothetical protein
MATYSLELDIPYSELEEFGFAKSRMGKDIAKLSPSIMAHSDHVMVEPYTGTVFLRPVHMDPAAWYSPDSDSLRLPLSSMDFVAGKWEQHPKLTPSVIAGDAGSHFMHRSKITIGGTLIDILGQFAEIATLMSGRILSPILATKSAFGINEGVFVEFEAYGQAGLLCRDYLAVRFGDFLLTLHMDGTADLYWSVDGTCNDHTWAWRKTFGHAHDLGGSVLTAGVGISTNDVVQVGIIPFGRGNIMVWIQQGHRVYRGIYTHPEATWDAVNERYLITKAGKVVVMAPGDAGQNVGVSISKVGYATHGTFQDEKLGLPYAPTTTPVIDPRWVKTLGAPTVTSALYDGAGAAWDTEAGARECRVRLTLDGDGTCTPWVDCYHLSFPEKIKDYTPTPFSLTEADIDAIEFSDGEAWEDQRVTVTLIDRGDDAALTALSTRSEINGRLLVDGIPYAIQSFERPKTVHGKRVSRITLTGKNFGVARVARKKFFWPADYGGLTHPVAIANVLNVCGFPDDEIVTDTDTITLPATTRNGEGTDKGETDLRTQPQFNSSVLEFIQYVRDSYSRWPLRYESDGKWYYQEPVKPTAAAATFRKDSTGETASTRTPYYRELSIDVEPPEANYVYMIGQTDSGEYIGNYAIDPESINSVADPKPATISGEWRPSSTWISTSTRKPTSMPACCECSTRSLTRSPGRRGKGRSSLRSRSATACRLRGWGSCNSRPSPRLRVRPSFWSRLHPRPTPANCSPRQALTSTWPTQNASRSRPETYI